MSYTNTRETFRKRTAFNMACVYPIRALGPDHLEADAVDEAAVLLDATVTPCAAICNSRPLSVHLPMTLIYWLKEHNTPGTRPWLFSPTIIQFRVLSLCVFQLLKHAVEGNFRHMDRCC